MQLGIPLDRCVNKEGIVDLFKLLGISPRLKADGSREITPYEILGVVPVFDNGKEKPIVFAIKNRAQKLGHYEGSQKTFFYVSKKYEKEKTVVESLKANYRRAVCMGDVEQAEKILSTLVDVSPEEARKLVSTFYDYSRYYKRMKKQLMLDLFSHFFLMYMSAVLISTKKGLAKNNNLYNGLNSEYEDDYSQGMVAGDVPDIAMDPTAFGINNMEKVTIKGAGEDGGSLSVNFKNKTASKPVVKPPVVQKIQPAVPQKEEPKPEEKEEKKEEKEIPIPYMFYGKKKSRVNKADKLLHKPFWSKPRYEERESKSFENTYAEDKKPAKSRQKKNQNNDYEIKYE